MLQALFCLPGDGIELFIADNAQHCLRIGNLDAAAVLDGAYHYVTGQE
jgi:hypothetical protein